MFQRINIHENFNHSSVNQWVQSLLLWSSMITITSTGLWKLKTDQIPGSRLKSESTRLISGIRSSHTFSVLSLNHGKKSGILESEVYQTTWNWTPITTEWPPSIPQIYISCCFTRTRTPPPPHHLLKLTVQVPARTNRLRDSFFTKAECSNHEPLTADSCVIITDLLILVTLFHLISLTFVDHFFVHLLVNEVSCFFFLFMCRITTVYIEVSWR